MNGQYEALITVATVIFLKKINSDGSFYVSEHCQHDISLLTAATGIFYLLGYQWISTPWIVFSTQARCDKTIFSNNQHFLQHASQNTLHIRLYISYGFYSSNLTHSFGFATFVNNLKTNIFSRLKYFAINQLQKNAAFTFLKKKFGKCFVLLIF